MSKPLRKLLVFILIVVVAFSHLSAAQAARGIPGSPDFGFGAAIHPRGALIKESMAAAVDLGLDWLYIEIPWASYQPEPGAAPRFDILDEIMSLAEQRQIAVAVSISQAPAWAQTPKGPDTTNTVHFIRALVERYPTAIQAVELFPGANTWNGWGSQPSPADYLAVYFKVTDLLREMESPILLVAAGLRPLSAQSTEKDMDDLAFLSGLYQLGASSLMPIVSLQYQNISGDPLALSDAAGVPVLRHYEVVRDIMIKNHHRKGLIWITRFTLPSGKISGNHSLDMDMSVQAVWLSQVYLQLRAQLYIGAAFLQSLNPEPEGSAAQIPSLVRSTNETHPFYLVLRDMIGFNKTGNLFTMPGKPKDGSLEKKRP